MNTGVRQVFCARHLPWRDRFLHAEDNAHLHAPGDANTVGGKPAGPAMSGNGSGVGIADNHSATLFTRSVAVDDRVFLAITNRKINSARLKFYFVRYFCGSGLSARSSSKKYSPRTTACRH